MTYPEILAVGFSRLTEEEMKSTEEAPPATPKKFNGAKGLSLSVLGGTKKQVRRHSMILEY